MSSPSRLVPLAPDYGRLLLDLAFVSMLTLAAQRDSRGFVVDSGLEHRTRRSETVTLGCHFRLDTRGATRDASHGAYISLVSSAALMTWQGERSRRIDEFLDAHTLVGGQGPGRRWRTSQLNRALVMLLATELQGFARKLHDLGSTMFAARAAAGNVPLERVLKARLTEGRWLDRGNAQPGSLGSDFGRLGFSLWPAMAARDPTTAVRQSHLEMLNQARNAIAHADEGQLAALRSEGYPMTLVTFKVWRRSMNGLAGTLDVEVAAQLGQLFDEPMLW